ncbi:Uncharacterised protein [Escherichia coli]|nr:Uncharacterised protein [Escherichia coli]
MILGSILSSFASAFTRSLTVVFKVTNHLQRGIDLRFPLAPVNQAVAAFLPGSDSPPTGGQYPPPARVMRPIGDIQNVLFRMRSAIVSAPNSEINSRVCLSSDCHQVIRPDVPSISLKNSRPIISPSARMPFMAFRQGLLDTREVVPGYGGRRVSSEPASPPQRLEPILSRAMPAIAPNSRREVINLLELLAASSALKPIAFRHCAVLPGEATHTPAHRHKGIFRQCPASAHTGLAR